MVTWISRYRPFLLRILVLLCIPLVLLTHHRWAEDAPLDLALDDVGYVLVAIGVLGRIWCTIYIGGRKNRELVTTGPYSLCRNPLYLFTIFLVAGLLCVFENVFLVIPVALAGAVTYISAIVREERVLAERFGPAWSAYAASVHRLLPVPWRYRGAGPGAGTVEFDPRLVLMGIRDSGLFLLLIPLAELIETMHVNGTLPVLLAG